MATIEAEVLSAVARNKDIHLIVGEDKDLFGAYGDAVDFAREHYLRYKEVPSKSLIEAEFPDIELPEATAPTPFYLDRLKSQFVNSNIEQIMLKASDAMEKGVPAKRVLDGLQTRLAKLGKYTTGARDLDLTDVESAEEYFKQVRQKAEENGGVVGISTGFKSIDAVYHTGIAPGQLIVPIGYTGRGKSMWTLLLAVNAWAQGKKVMIVSLEMSPEEVRDRAYAMMSSGLFKISDLSRGDIQIDNFHAWGQKSLKDKAQFIVTSNEGVGMVTPNWVQAKVDTHRPDLVICDYAQLMVDNGKTTAMTPRMLNVSSEMKRLAMANAVPVVLISAVTDEDGDKRDGPPLLSQIAWSSGIEYDANLVVAVHRHDDTNTVEVVARKSRHGDLFDFGYLVDFDAGVWQERHDIFD